MAGGLNPDTLAFTLFVADGPDWLGEIDAYESFELVARFNDVSTWKLTAHHDPRRPAAAGRHQPRVVVATAPEVVFRSGPVVAFEREITSDGDLLTVTGVDDLIWLRYRLAHPQPATPTPPYSTSAFDTRTGSAAEVIAAPGGRQRRPGAVTARRARPDRPGPRRPGAQREGVRPLPEPVDLVKRVAARARLGVEIRDLEFTVFQPTDPRAVFSADLGTLAGWTSVHEAPSANYVYMAGGGLGTNRLIAEYDDVDSVAVWGRMETFEDHRDTTDPDELDEAGAEVLADASPPPS